MNLQFFQYSNDTILKYETDSIISATILPDVQNTIIHDTLGGYKVVQKIRNPIDIYEFILQGVNYSDFVSFQDHLRLNNYGIKILYPKTSFGLESKRGGFVTVTSISDESYKHLDLSDVNRLVDVTFRFTPFSWTY